MVRYRPIACDTLVLTIRGILVEHERSTGFDLGIQDGEPKLLCLDDLSELAFTFILFVEFVESLAVNVGQSRALVGTHQRPVSIGLYTSHKHVRNPERVEQVSSSDFFLAVVLSQVDEIEDIRVPRFEVDAVERVSD